MPPRLIDLGNPVADHPLNYGLAGWWLGLPNNFGGGTWFDLLGRWPLTIGSGPTWVMGPVGFACLNYTGSGAATSTDTPSSPGTGLFGVSCWMRTTNGGLQVAAGTEGTGGNWWIGSNGGDPRLSIAGSTLTGGVSVNDDRWHHFYAARVDGSGGCEIWIDGALVNTNTMSANVNAAALGVGRFGSASGFDWTGQIDGFRYWVGVAPPGSAVYQDAARGHHDTLRRSSRRAWFVSPPASGRTGDLSATLGALTSSAAGAVAVAGTAANTLGTLTASAAGAVAVAGAAANTLGALALAADGAVAVAGTSSATLGALTSSAAGAVTIVGASSVTLGTLASSAAGTVAVVGTLSATLGGVSITAAGVVVDGNAASLAVTLDAMTSSAAGTVAVSGDAAPTLGALTSSATGAVTLSGATAAALGSLALSASGAVAVVGTSAATLGAVTLTGAGGGGAATATIPAGTFRRPPWSWPRTHARPLPSWRRTHARPLPSWSRTWRFAVPQLPVQTLTPVVGDDRDYLIDLSSAPEIAGGDTIAAAAVVQGENSAGLTFGAPAATAAAADGIAAGKAVQVQISGWAEAVVYTFAVRVTLASGRKLTVPCRAVPGGDT